MCMWLCGMDFRLKKTRKAYLSFHLAGFYPLSIFSFLSTIAQMLYGLILHFFNMQFGFIKGGIDSVKVVGLRGIVG
jgi:hypothetical protein